MKTSPNVFYKDSLLIQDFAKKKKVEPSAENYVIYHASVNILQSGMICVVIADIHWLLFRKSELL
jgi:hypothetical protein